MNNLRSGFVASGQAKLYHEAAGSGSAMVMIHAGVADHRQWNAAFDHFQNSHSVLRYDMRGFGQSEPVEGSFRAIDDLNAVLAEVNPEEPKIMMGCSMGGTLAMDYTLTNPDEVSALIMVCSGPSGLSLDVAEPDKFALVEKADAAGDLDRVCELETQIWFDGAGRAPTDVPAESRALLYEMNRIALAHESRHRGERKPDLTPAAYSRLHEIKIPVMILTGALDIPFMAAAADVMCEAIPHAHRVEFADTAHLPSMEHPDLFNQTVAEFLGSHSLM